MRCSLLSEPVSTLATLFAAELELEVAWRGTQDSCSYQAGGRPAPTRDLGSPAKRALDEALDEGRADQGASRASSGAAALRDPEHFARSMLLALAQDAAFVAADLGLCTEPAFACLPMHRAGKAVIGYFGVHVGFMLHNSADQAAFYHEFSNVLARDPRNTFATVAPHVSLQIFHHVPVEVPAVRPLSLYTQPAFHTASRADEVLVNKRPTDFWKLTRLLDSCARLNSVAPLRFVETDSLAKSGRSTYSDWAAFRAAVYFPYDWLQTMMFYDWLALGLPTFVQDTPMHTFATGSNPRTKAEAMDANLLYSHHWDAVEWQAPHEALPHHYGNWHDLPGRVFWWRLTDLRALPGVGSFSSVAELLASLSSKEALQAMTSRTRLAHLERTGQAALFWRGALTRALATAVQ